MIAFWMLSYLYFFVWYCISLRKKDFSLFDLAWGGGVILPAIVAFPFRMSLIKSILIILISLWAIRLTVHLTDRYRRVGKDRRYQEMSQTWGKLWPIHGFVKVFLLQSTIACFVILPPLLLILSSADSIPMISYLGATIAGLGLVLESVADYQLKEFKLKKSQTPFMREGVWKYSRHPNYVGEVIFWWGIWIYCLPYIPYWSVLSPLMMHLLIRYVSGVPLLENHWKKNPEFPIYAKEVPIFWPFFSFIRYLTAPRHTH